MCRCQEKLELKKLKKLRLALRRVVEVVCKVQSSKQIN
jgi:hypothetical protein